MRLINRVKIRRDNRGGNGQHIRHPQQRAQRAKNLPAKRQRGHVAVTDRRHGNNSVPESGGDAGEQRVVFVFAVENEARECDQVYQEAVDENGEFVGVRAQRDPKKAEGHGVAGEFDERQERKESENVPEGMRESRGFCYADQHENRRRKKGQKVDQPKHRNEIRAGALGVSEARQILQQKPRNTQLLDNREDEVITGSATGAARGAQSGVVAGGAGVSRLLEIRQSPEAQGRYERHSGTDAPANNQLGGAAAH